LTPYYQDNLVTIYHGDCREWMPEADVIVTDPPYGINVLGNGGRMGFSAAVYRPVLGDREPLDPTWLLGKAGRVIVFGADHFTVHPSGGRYLVWDKRGGLAGNDFSDAEIAWDSAPGVTRLFTHRHRGFTSQVNDDRTGPQHPTQKPVAVMRWLIAMTEGMILDPYLGSGSTLVAAKSLNRQAIGIEIDERYCEVAANRCRQEVLGLTTV
jgi:site-specific DNA-methyltransferase (adenine-specific)